MARTLENKVNRLLLAAENKVNKANKQIEIYKNQEKFNDAARTKVYREIHQSYVIKLREIINS